MNKSTLLVFFFVFSFSCSKNNKNIYGGKLNLVDWNEIVNKDSNLEKRVIKVCGWFKAKQEQCTIAKSKNEVNNLIWITPQSEICLPIKVFKNPIEGWAIVSGNFYNQGGFGHLGQYKYTLHAAKITLLKSSCQ